MKSSGQVAIMLKEASDALSWFDMIWKEVASFSVTIETDDSKKRIPSFPFYDQDAAESLYSEAMNIKGRIDEALREHDANV